MLHLLTWTMLCKNCFTRERLFLFHVRLLLDGRPAFLSRQSYIVLISKKEKTGEGNLLGSQKLDYRENWMWSSLYALTVIQSGKVCWHRHVCTTTKTNDKTMEALFLHFERARHKLSQSIAGFDWLLIIMFLLEYWIFSRLFIYTESAFTMPFFHPWLVNERRKKKWHGFSRLG